MTGVDSQSVSAPCICKLGSYLTTCDCRCSSNPEIPDAQAPGEFSRVRPGPKTGGPAAVSRQVDAPRQLERRGRGESSQGHGDQAGRENRRDFGNPPADWAGIGIYLLVLNPGQRPKKHFCRISLSSGRDRENGNPHLAGGITARRGGGGSMLGLGARRRAGRAGAVRVKVAATATYVSGYVRRFYSTRTRTRPASDLVMLGRH